MAIFKKDEVFAGRYILCELIGEGGFSEVWKAMDSMVNDTTIAIKIYVPEKGLDEYGIRQFQKEYSITHHLSHPHLMKIFYFDIADGSPYLIMPYYEQGSLSRYLQTSGTFDEPQLARLMYQMGSALSNLHEQQPTILHQDIKPHNILIKDGEHFILADFGISSNTRQTLRKATSSANSLTTAYAPPERFDEVPFTNEASDIFSLGVTMYEMCTGTVPWDGNGGQSLLKGAKVPKLPPKFSGELSQMLQACMSPDLGERPSAEQLMRWGKDFLAHRHWQFYAEASGKRKSTKRMAIPAIALTLTLVVAVALYYVFIHKTDSLPPVIDETTLADENTLTDTAAVFRSGDAESIQAATLVMKNKALVEKASIIQKTDSLSVTKDKMLAALNETAVIRTDTKVAPVEKQVAEKSDTYASPGNLEEYLNGISNPVFPRAVRKKWKEEALQLFAGKSVQVLNEKSGLGNRYTATALLDLLMDFPHQVKISGVDKDTQDKITQLRLQMDRQPK